MTILNNSRNQLKDIPPADIVAAAEKVRHYFANLNITGWELGGVMDRFDKSERPVGHINPHVLEKLQRGELSLAPLRPEPFETRYPDVAVASVPVYARPPVEVMSIEEWQARQQAPEKYDDVLLPFLALMRAELHANSHKGDRSGWLQMAPSEALLEIYYHIGKLQKAVHDEDKTRIKEHAADVANMSMMLLDICGGLTACSVCGDNPTFDSLCDCLPNFGLPKEAAAEGKC